jgi:hypothetical protein
VKLARRLSGTPIEREERSEILWKGKLVIAGQRWKPKQMVLRQACQGREQEKPDKPGEPCTFIPDGVPKHGAAGLCELDMLATTAERSSGKVPENTHSLKAELLVETGIEVIPPSPSLRLPPLFRLSLDTRRLHHSQLGVGIFAGCSR